MRVTYEWTQAEWNEAVDLATEKARRRGSVPGLVYALIGIPLFGAILDGATALRHSGTLRRDHATVPLLLLGLAAAMAVGVAVSWWWKRHQRVTTQAPMPDGQWQMVLQEAGWSVSPMHSAKLAPANVAAPPMEIAPGTDSSHAAQPLEAAAKSDTQAASAAKSSSAAATMPSPVVHPQQATVGPAQTVSTAPDTSRPETNDAAPAETLPSQPSALAQLQASHADHEPGTEQTAPSSQETNQVPVATSALEPWHALSGSRAGNRVIVLLHGTGFHAVPVRCMTPDQASHMHRMVLRKLRPTPAARAVPPGI